MAPDRSPAGGLPVAWRLPLLVGGMLSLLAGLAAGLTRLGWELPLSPAPMSAHGPLMVAAFFGTVIGLERAVALGRGWGYLSPLSSAAGGFALLANAPAVLAFPLLMAGAAVLMLATLRAAQRQPALHAAMLVLAAAFSVVASAAWWAGATSAAIAAWMLFLVLTIAGERLELSRFLPPSPQARRVFLVLVAVLVVAVLAMLVGIDAAWRLLGAALAGLAVWLLRQDVARRTVRQSGLTRFIAVCLLSGYGWLLLGGALLLLQPPVTLLADAALHAVFVGFVLAMVFGHAPIIFPAIVKVRLPYHPLFYLPLLALHLSLLLRVAGDFLGDVDVRAWGGLGNAACVALFIVTMASAAWRGRRIA